MALLRILANLWYSEEIFERLEIFISCVKLAWISEEQRYNWNLLEPRSFNMYKNTTALIIVIWDYSEVNTRVLDVGIKTVGSNNYKEVLRNNRYTNSILVVMLEIIRFFHKNK